MEKPTINFSLRTLISKFRRSHEESIDPSTLWRATLWTTLVLILAAGGFAYTTYDWAIGVEAPTTVSRSARDQFSLTELREVIANYHQKEVNFEALLKMTPQPPDYQKTKGASEAPPVTDNFLPDELDDVSNAPTRTQ